MVSGCYRASKRGVMSGTVLPNGAGHEPGDSVPGTMHKSISSVYLPQGKGVLVSFRDISYAVTNRENKRQKLNLLSSVCGYFRAGEMAALMGPSGCGTCIHVE